MATLRSSAQMADGRRVEVRCTGRAEGDFSPAFEPAELLAKRRAAIHSEPWTWLRQIHGAAVVHPNHSGDQSGAKADAMVLSVSHAPGCIQTADCVPLVLVGDSAVAVVHAGWQGWMAGVVDQAAEALAQPVAAVWFGPHIGVEDYEFGRADLDQLADRFGDAVVGATRHGVPGLDLYEVMAATARRHGWPTPKPIGGVRRSTASSDFFSHRLRADPERQTTVVWLERT